MDKQEKQNVINLETRPKLTVWQVIKSVLAAAFGVQKTKNLKRDFSYGKPSTFIIAGIIFTAIFVLAVFGVVKTVLYFVGV